MFIQLIFFGFLLAESVRSHGTLMEPPNRSYMWRVKDEDPAIIPYKDIVEENWNDNQLYCGGFQHQQNLGGKCGLCGDPYDGVRDNEAGGKYGKGIIVRQYSQGSMLEVSVKLTAHHLGFFEFRLCPWNNPTVPGTHDCLNQYLLPLLNGSTQYFPPKKGEWVYNYQLQLPREVTCDQCILQWKYHAGNTWACDETGKCCLGCGPQEKFYGCADIAIGDGPTLAPPGWNEPPVVTTSSTQPPSTTTTAAPSTSKSTTTERTETNQPPIPPTTTPPIDTDQPSCDGKPPGQYQADCDTFYTCANNGAGPFLYNCPPGTVYDESRKICDYPYTVPPPCGTKP
ncbi:uncharacterized protein LOC143446325 [Clavelina lepadiformis]|uniref:uncharacterized protein LOC143446325 n=1 Tax=Clavelina lepadiformis TaxID=159417 RepID=UPI0040423E3F